jgi:hypothetical protein
MSTTDAAPAAAAARLVLRLPGTWVQLDPSRPEVTDRRIRVYVDLAMGRADELAKARADMRKAVGAMIQSADSAASLESVFLCHEVAPGTPTPIAVSVFAPAELHLSPVIGTNPADVIDGYLAAMDAIGDGEGWERRACVDGESVRRWRISETVLADGLEDQPVRSFSADYWRTVPDTKRLVLITVTSPLADIPETLLRLADAIVAGSRFVTRASGGLGEEDATASE